METFKTLLFSISFFVISLVALVAIVYALLPSNMTIAISEISKYILA